MIRPFAWFSPRAIVALVALAIVLAAGAFSPVAYAAFVGLAVAFVAAVAADVAIGPRGDLLGVERIDVPRLAIGRAATLSLALDNRSGTGVRVGVVETLPAIVRGDSGERRARVAAGGRTVVAFDIVPGERGPVDFGPVSLWFENVLGLVRRRRTYALPLRARVFPDLTAIESYGVLARRSTLVDAGLRKLRMRGVGSEFESLREYVDGDAFRAVDWKATARRGRLMVANLEVERSQQVFVALDAGRLMTARLDGVRKFDYALTAALSVAEIAARAGDNVGLTAFAARTLIACEPRRGLAYVRTIADRIADVQPRYEEPDYERICAEIKRRHSKRSLVVLFTDIFDPITSASILAGVATLVPRHLVMCVLMNDAAIARALDEPAATPGDAYRAAVAVRLETEREAAVAQLRARGTIVVDVAATQLTSALLDAYLDVKARGRL